MSLNATVLMYRIISYIKPHTGLVGRSRWPHLIDKDMEDQGQTRPESQGLEVAEPGTKPRSFSSQSPNSFHTPGAHSLIKFIILRSNFSPKLGLLPSHPPGRQGSPCPPEATRNPRPQSWAQSTPPGLGPRTRPLTLSPHAGVPQRCGQRGDIQADLRSVLPSRR